MPQDHSILQNILLNDNAYFYSNIDEISLSRNRLAQLFQKVSSDKAGHYLLNVIGRPINLAGVEYHYSICAFKYVSRPSLLDEDINGWEEIKIAYLLIFDFKNYIVIIRRNISKLQDFIRLFQPIDYSILSTLHVGEDTQIEKLDMQNMNISDRAMRQKIVESADLRENFTALGANNYVVNHLRVKNEDEKVSLSLNTSRINKFGTKSTIVEVGAWAFEQINKIETHTERSTFLSIFAQHQDYSAIRHELIPIALLFIFSKLYQDFDNNYIHAARFVSDSGLERPIDLIKYINRVETLLQVSDSGHSATGVYTIENPYVSDLQMKLNEKSISIRSQKLGKIVLYKDNGRTQTIIDYLNSSQQFVINFDFLDLVYTKRKLFRDSRLIGSIDHFLTVFNANINLTATSSEKGAFLTSSTEFQVGSIFRFVEDTFLPESDFFLCDDLSKEWADHIGLTSDKIMFFHSKYKDALYSASAFQDIVGQAQKNLGNLTPQDFQLELKREFWGRDYNAPNVQTNIPRLRKGSSVDDFITQFKQTSLNPNHQREVYLALNFISKAGLQEKLYQLRDGEPFAERNEIIQILWFISSLINSCHEVGAEVYIYCNP
ncbi:MAG: hypothetical protein EOO51_00145 [Flavobacterium sp.]|nr:MAG: hypothetical protein EOO51_00145 [Flavobacterium sp.]